MPLFRRSKKKDVEGTLPVDPAYGDPDGARLRQAMLDGDWPTARAVLTAATNPDDHAFYVDLTSRMQGCEEWLPDVVRAEPDSTLPLLVYGTRAIGWAWDARGATRAKYVGRDQFEVFFDRLRIADDCLRAVVRREPDNVTAWQQLIITARGQELGIEEARRRFDEVVRRHPGNFRAHTQLLQQLCRKWGGSHEQMHAFAREAMLKAPAGSPLGHLVAAAHLEHWLDLDGDLGEGYIRSPEVRASLNEAADRSVRHPDYRRPRNWPYVHNMFAMAFSLARDYHAAVEQYQIIGDMVSEHPWGYLAGDPGNWFCRFRQVAYTGARGRR